jgi:hypothetical protein
LLGALKRHGVPTQAVVGKVVDDIDKKVHVTV